MSSSLIITENEIINQHIDPLIKSLTGAHLIYLNDNMLLVKLHRNPKFTEWLNKNMIMPKFKSYYGSNNRLRYGTTQPIGAPVLPQFITICIIPNVARN